MNFDTLCFSSGGIQAISFIGAINYLIDNNYIDISKINTFVGSSAGGILAFLLSINYSINELTNFINNYDLKNIEPDYDIELILNKFGINDGSKIMNLLIKFLEDKMKIKDITFIELYKITNKKLLIVGTNYSKGIETIFSYETTPNISILTALRITISIPLIFTPVILENEIYMDGGMINNYPIDLCDPETTLGFRLINPKSFKLESLQDLIVGTLCIITQKNNIKNTNYCIEINIYDTSFVDFTIDSNYINNLIKNGKVYSKKYLKYIYIKKINELTKLVEIAKKENIEKLNNLTPIESADDIISEILNDIII
jgi:NTE family protein